MKYRSVVSAFFLVFILGVTTGCWTVVDDYEVGVGKNRFSGKVYGELYQGWTWTIFKSVTKYPTREVQHPVEGESEVLDVLSADNMTINVDAAFRWRAERDSVRATFLRIGDMNAARAYIYNAYREAVRDAVSEVNAADLLSAERQSIGNRVETLLAGRSSGGVVVTDVFIRGIDPPPALKKAVDEKLAREQQVQAEKFQTQVVTEQANQRRAEALGIKDAQQIIATSLDGERGKRYLYWSYLEKLGKIGEGQNNLVIAPTESGIPLFFGMGGKQ